MQIDEIGEKWYNNNNNSKYGIVERQDDPMTTKSEPLPTISELKEFFEKNGCKLIDAEPFDEKSDAYKCIERYYHPPMKGITAYPYKDKYYVVQAKYLM